MPPEWIHRVWAQHTQPHIHRVCVWVSTPKTACEPTSRVSRCACCTCCCAASSSMSLPRCWYCSRMPCCTGMPSAWPCSWAARLVRSSLLSGKEAKAAMSASVTWYPCSSNRLQNRDILSCRYAHKGYLGYCTAAAQPTPANVGLLAHLSLDVSFGPVQFFHCVFCGVEACFASFKLCLPFLKL